MAILSLVDDERQWFKSCHGLEIEQTPRSASFCAHAVMDDEMLVVEDALKDPRFEFNPLVVAAPKIRFYAGQPVHAPDGSCVGTLSVLDRRPRTFAADDAAALKDLAGLVEDQLRVETYGSVLAEVDAQRHRFQTLAGHAPVGVFETDVQGNCVYTNEAWNEITGLTPEQAYGKGWIRAIHPDDRSAVAQAWREATKLQSAFMRTFRFQRPNGDVRWVRVQASPVRSAAGEVLAWVGVDEDVTEDLERQHSLAENQERFQQLASASDQVFWITDVQTHAVLYVSPAYEKIWGRSAQSIYDNPWDWVEAIHPDDRAKAQAAFQEVLDGSECFEVEFRIQRPDGTIRYILDRGFPVRNEAGELIRMAGTAVDFTQAFRVREELRKLAHTDSLTGAVNRRTFDDLLEHQVKYATRTGQPLSVGMIDLDNFKLVNDRYGHPAGDAALKLVAEILRERVRASDVVARIGGDEFAVILSGCDQQNCREMLESVARRVRDSVIELPPDKRLSVTMSIGATTLSKRHVAPAELMARADQALYQAKREGRDRVVVDAFAEEGTRASPQTGGPEP